MRSLLVVLSAEAHAQGTRSVEVPVAKGGEVSVADIVARWREPAIYHLSGHRRI